MKIQQFHNSTHTNIYPFTMYPHDRSSALTMSRCWLNDSRLVMKGGVILRNKLTKMQPFHSSIHTNTYPLAMYPHHRGPTTAMSRCGLNDSWLVMKGGVFKFHLLQLVDVKHCQDHADTQDNNNQDAESARTLQFLSVLPHGGIICLK